MKGKQLIYVKKPRSMALRGLAYTQISKKTFLTWKQGWPVRHPSSASYLLPSRLSLSVPELHRISRRTIVLRVTDFSSSRCCHRRSGIAPCPEDRIDLVCHYIIPAFHTFATLMLTGPMDSGFLHQIGLSGILPRDRFPAG